MWISLIFWPLRSSNVAHYTSKKGCKYREKNSSSGSQWGDFFLKYVSYLFLDRTNKSENMNPEFWIFTNFLIHNIFLDKKHPKNKYVGVNKTLEKISPHCVSTLLVTTATCSVLMKIIFEDQKAWIFQQQSYLRIELKLMLQDYCFIYWIIL